MKILNTDTKQIVELPKIVVNRFDCSADVYGNSGIYHCFEDGDVDGEYQLAGTGEEIDWWTAYGEDYMCVTRMIETIESYYDESFPDDIITIDSIIADDRLISEYVWDTGEELADECAVAMQRAKEILEALGHHIEK